MAEITYNTLPHYGWDFSLDLVGKGHPIAKRVFETYEDIETYVSDPNSSAVSGIIVVALKDSEGHKAGAYLIKQALYDPKFNPEATEAIITPLATGETVKIQAVLGERLPEGAEIGTVLSQDGKIIIPDMRTYWTDNSF